MLLQAIPISLALLLSVSVAFHSVTAALGLDHDLEGNQDKDNDQNILLELDDSGDHQDYDDQSPQHFSDQWAVHIPGGERRADLIASRHGFQNTGQIFPDYYHFVHRKVAKRSLEPCREFFDRLESEPEVRWHAQQVVKSRTKRDYLQLSSNSKPLSGSRSRPVKRSQSVTFNDPRWPAMWYLNRGPGLDMNVQEAWAEGITGKGIVVTILDDGLEKDHPDIQRNYDPLASFDVNSLDMDPMPTYDLTDSNRHGTRCAGEVAAEANNSLCAVGVAYEASVGGVRMLDGDVTDAVEARSLSHNPQHIDIYSASWGPDDDGKTVDGPGELATRAFIEGITKGRGGKGSIFVWASGNGGRDHDNCNCDGYTNSIWTLSISSATENGLVPWYSEACSSTLATTYSSGGTGEKQIVTIDLHHSCTSSHTGTSASAPLAAGICALALQANTNLTWRDMQHIVVRTARPFNLISPDWATNGVGRNVSHSFGYGLMDATAMVRLAKKWRTVPEQNRCEIRAPFSDKNIPAKSKVTLDLKVTDCVGVNVLEHVQAKVTLTSGRRGDLQIYLVSPSGTRSLLLAHRRHDLNRSGFTDWPFMTVHCWGESPFGKWTLEIHNEGRYPDHKNGRTVLKRWSLLVYGIEADANEVGELTPGAIKPFLSKFQGQSRPLFQNSSGDIKLTVGIPDDSHNSQEQQELGQGVARIKPWRPKFRGKILLKKQKSGTHSPTTPINPPDIDLTIQTPPTVIEFDGSTSSILDNNRGAFFDPISELGKDELGELEEGIHNLNHSQPTTTPEGKLQTWSIVAHGITRNPNDDKYGGGNSNPGVAPALPKPISNFDDSENRLLMEPAQAHSPPLASANANEMEVVADVSSTMTSSPSSAGKCVKLSESSGKCLECMAGLFLLHAGCVSLCPDNFFAGYSTAEESRNFGDLASGGICFPCHYSCRTCNGSYDDDCTTCHSDSVLFTTKQKGTRNRNPNLYYNYCYPIALVNSIENNDYWYRALLTAVIVCVVLIVILLVYSWVLRSRVGNRSNGASSGAGWLERRMYSRVSPDEDNPSFDNEIYGDVEYAIPASSISPILGNNKEKDLIPPPGLPLLHNSQTL